MKLTPVLQGLAIYVPVILLILVGVVIAIGSGAEGDSEAHGLSARLLLKNGSQMILRIFGYVAILIAVQYLVGMRPSLGW